MNAPTRHNILLVTGGRISLLAIWFVGNILLMRRLDLDSFGVYALAAASIKIFTGCLGDALDLSVMREVPLHLKSNRALALGVIRSSFWLRAAIGAITLAIAALLPAFIARQLLGDEKHLLIVFLVGVGIIADLLAKSSLGYFQACESFARLILLESLLQIGRFLAIIALIATGHLNSVSAVCVFAIAPLAVFAVSLPLLPRDVTAFRAAPRKQMAEMIAYAKWIGLSMAIAAIYERVDVFMLGAFRDLKEVGLYSAALTLATIPDHFTGCLSTVIQPKIPVAYRNGQFIRLAGRFFMYVAPIALAGILCAWLLGTFVIQTFLSEKYAGAVFAFKVLVTGSLIGLALNPLPNALVAFVAPRVLTIVTMFGLLMSSVAGYLIIPKYGVIGAAGMIVSVRIVISLTMTLIAFSLSARREATAGEIIPASIWPDAEAPDATGGQAA